VATPRPEDREFLESYDSTEFAHPSVTVDVCLLTVADAALQVMLLQRVNPPFEGMFALPGGFVRMDESLEDAARRVLLEETGVRDIYLEQLYTFGDPSRDPRTRVITVAYVALVPIERVILTREAQARFLCWFPIAERRGEAAPIGPSGRAETLAFDHGQIVSTAIERVRGKLEYTTIAFQLLPREFTLTEIQRVFETILERKLAKAAFRRRILEAGVVRPTSGERRGGHRPARLYRFVERNGAERP
jgi:8-oxo-dGTP diphosphatase